MGRGTRTGAGATSPAVPGPALLSSSSLRDSSSSRIPAPKLQADSSSSVLAPCCSLAGCQGGLHPKGCHGEGRDMFCCHLSLAQGWGCPSDRAPEQNRAFTCFMLQKAQSGLGWVGHTEQSETSDWEGQVSMRAEQKVGSQSGGSGAVLVYLTGSLHLPLPALHHARISG